MPKSKRSKVVSLTKTAKKTKEHKEHLLKEVQENAEKWEYVYVFEVGDMRNAPLKDVRKLWKDSGRIFFGRCTVMAKGLGTTVETEHRPGLHQLAQKVKGQVGLFFTNSPPQEVQEWFDDFKVPSFARAKQPATKTVVIPAGPVMQRHSSPPTAFPHSMEPQLRKLGLSTRMERGVPTIDVEHTVCKEGDALTPEQSQLLKLIGEKLATFKVTMLARWEGKTGEVTQLAESSPETTVVSEEVDMANGDEGGEEE